MRFERVGIRFELFDVPKTIAGSLEQVRKSPDCSVRSAKAKPWSLASSKRSKLRDCRRDKLR